MKIIDDKIEIITELWNKLYSDNHKLEILLDFLKSKKDSFTYTPKDKFWYKKGLVYSTYVDLFAGDFDKMKETLDYLSNLGVTILWLLPNFTVSNERPRIRYF